MKPFKILIVLCLMSGFGLEGINAQIPPASSYQITNNISSLQIGNLSPTHVGINSSQINCRINRIPILTDLTKNTGSIFDATSIKHYEFINTKTIINWSNDKMSVELAAKGNYGTTCTFKIKWESLPRIPFIDQAVAYYCPLKRTDELTLCNCRIYRAAAFIIPRLLQFQYPGANSTIIYPPAYLNPNYSFIEKSK